MLVEQVVKKQKRNYNVEKELLLNLAKFLNPYISLEDIKKRLKKNGFKGVYIVDEFDSVETQPNVLGIYSDNDKAIVLKREEYNKDKTIGTHEMGHAFLNGRNIKNIIFDNRLIGYGYGLEEGAMAFLQYSSSIKDINEVNSKVYAFQCNLFKQLSVLYSYSKSKKYENLLIHLFMEPETFIPLISNIYEDIYTEKFKNSENSLSIKSAFNLISGTDALLEYNDTDLYLLLSYINTIYLYMANKNADKENSYKKIFINFDDIKMREEEIILLKIFNSDINYMKRLEIQLKATLCVISNLLDNFDNKKTNDVNNKILTKK